MTTTRETADHAELTRIEALLREHIRVDASGLAPAVVSHFVFGFDTAASALLSEIATLRGERDRLAEELHNEIMVCAGKSCDADVAERQRDELRKALGDVLFIRKDNPKASDRWMLEEVHRISRIALANQGADQ